MLEAMVGSPSRRLVCSLAATAASVLTAACSDQSSNQPWLANTATNPPQHAAGGVAGTTMGGASDTATGGAADSTTSFGSGQGGTDTTPVLGNPGAADNSGAIDAGTCDVSCFGYSSYCSRSTGLRSLCVLIEGQADAGVDAGFDAGARCTIPFDSSGDPVAGVLLECTLLDVGSYTLDSPGRLRLQGEACDALETSALHHITIVLGCPVDA